MTSRPYGKCSLFLKGIGKKTPFLYHMSGPTVCSVGHLSWKLGQKKIMTDFDIIWVLLVHRSAGGSLEIADYIMEEQKLSFYRLWDERKGKDGGGLRDAQTQRRVI